MAVAAGVPANAAEAARQYQLASNQGNAIATTNLALLYDSGNGVPSNAAKAAQLFREASAQASQTCRNIVVAYVSHCERFRLLSHTTRRVACREVSSLRITTAGIARKESALIETFPSRFDTTNLLQRATTARRGTGVTPGSIRSP